MYYYKNINLEESSYMNIDEAENSESVLEIPGAEPTVTSVAAAFDDTNEKLTRFIDKNIAWMKSQLMKDHYDNLSSINRAYMGYLPASWELNKLYQRARADEKRAQAELEAFDDQAMDETKRELNRDDNKKTWFSPTELKAAAHTKYKAKYAQLHARVTHAEGRRSFMERLCKAWDSWQFSLGQISRNLIAEANANGLDMKAQGMLPADPDDHSIESIVNQAMRPF